LTHRVGARRISVDADQLGHGHGNVGTDERGLVEIDVHADFFRPDASKLAWKNNIGDFHEQADIA
jgi:hypothetical protein